MLAEAKKVMAEPPGAVCPRSMGRIKAT